MSVKYLIVLSFVLLNNCYATIIRDDRYLHLFITDHNSTEAAPPVTRPHEEDTPTTEPQTGTTYDWGQWTDPSRTTYDWGQWTDPNRTTYDWGQWTSTSGPEDENSTSTGSPSTEPSRTTYDWGQWTKTRTTYDWGQWTSTSGPEEENSTTTQNPNEQNKRYKCTAGKYACAGTVGMCISLDQVCDGKQDCPHMDDESPKMCYPPFGGQKSKKKNVNRFSGMGFMFHIKNIIVRDGSEAKLFNQQSDNNGTDSKSIIVNKIGNSTDQ